MQLSYARGTQVPHSCCNSTFVIIQRGWIWAFSGYIRLSWKGATKIRSILHQHVEKYLYRVARIYGRIAARCPRDARITNTLHPNRMIDTRYPSYVLPKVETGMIHRFRVVLYCFRRGGVSRPKKNPGNSRDLHYSIFSLPNSLRALFSIRRPGRSAVHCEP